MICYNTFGFSFKERVLVFVFELSTYNMHIPYVTQIPICVPIKLNLIQKNRKDIFQASYLIIQLLARLYYLFISWTWLETYDWFPGVRLTRLSGRKSDGFSPHRRWELQRDLVSIVRSDSRAYGGGQKGCWEWMLLCMRQRPNSQLADYITI